jgi:hypothetical protein
MGCSLTPLIDSYNHPPLEFIYSILVSNVIPESFSPIIHNFNNTNFNDLIDIMFVYDILNNNVNCPAILNLIGFRIPSRYTRNSNLFHVPNFNTNSGKNSFFSRAVFNANRISTVLDFFVLPRQLFKTKTLLFLKHNA